MVKNDALIQSQATTLKNLVNQIGQLATELLNRLQGALLSDTENARNLGKEHRKVVALQSCKTLEPKEVVVEDELIEKEESEPTVEIPAPAKRKPINPEQSNPKFQHLHILKKFQPNKQKQEVQFKKFLDVLN
ncbi:Integrase-like protein [Gossypium australe]|uniref:Integrase-like protein n=1 Tax=Gossypium australe TaxID=47621 RepID=A0A5B6VL11_9ROSI|nr:Integrase-like protein [Gossypium australe]